jgi:hypothetical protein
MKFRKQKNTPINVTINIEMAFISFFIRSFLSPPRLLLPLICLYSFFFLSFIWLSIFLPLNNSTSYHKGSALKYLPGEQLYWGILSGRPVKYCYSAFKKWPIMEIVWEDSLIFLLIYIFLLLSVLIRSCCIWFSIWDKFLLSCVYHIHQ